MWEKTVMKAQTLTDVIIKASKDKNCTKTFELLSLEAQAEITWDIAFKAGVRKVVEEVGLHCYIWHDENNKVHICLDQETWKAKLKEWDINRKA